MNIDSMWDAVLAKLESDADLAEKAILSGDMSLADLEPWSPPELQDSLPADLRPRAVALALRQENLTVALQREMAAARRHDKALGHLAGPADRPAVYVDEPA